MSPQVAIDPRPTPVDGPVEVHVLGLTPAARVTLRARLIDDAGLGWSSEATFTADDQGEIHTATAEPASGSYRDAHGDGLFWSMVPDAPEEALEHALKQGLAPTRVTVSVEQSGYTIAEDGTDLVWLKDGVTQEEVRQDGLVGTAFIPAGPGPYRPVLVFGGSDGGLRLDTAALLAGHGFFTLALAYFRHPGLPEALLSIPLEYFERALEWLRRDPRSEAARGVGVVGRSRGGELALLLGATFPQVDAVVAYVPSAIVHAGIEAGGPSWQVNVPAWTRGGAPVPYLGHGTAVLAVEELTPPIALTPIYCRDLSDWHAASRAAIPLERSKGPILMLSGAADAMWPSSLLSDLGVARLASSGSPPRFQHLAFPNAGHRFIFPTLPGTVTSGRHPADATVYEYGGTPLGNARAAALAHQAMIDWFRREPEPS